MLRWLGPRKASEPPDPQSGTGYHPAIGPSKGQPVTTDDPLALLGPKEVYSVSRSVFLPRVALKSGGFAPSGGAGVNPLFKDHSDSASPKNLDHFNRQSSPPSASKSSGYSGSHYESSIDPSYHEGPTKLREPTNLLLDQNPVFIKSIKVPVPRTQRKPKSVPSSGSSGSTGGTLTTIPEGKVDQPIPKPIWPLDQQKYDSLVDEALLLYTSLNYHPERTLENYIDLSVKDLLLELLNSINDKQTPPEDMLKIINEKIKLKLDLLRNSTEDEMRKLCVNLSNNKKINSVLRAFSHSSNSGSLRTSSSDGDDLYHIPSGSSSSGFSDSVKDTTHVLPVFVHDDLVSVPNGLRNAMIYGTLCRTKQDKFLLDQNSKKQEVIVARSTKPSLLRAPSDEKPSVWAQYYGLKVVEDGVRVLDTNYVRKPTDIPLFPGGRPEADFTLDVPRSELLSKKMREDKKWRCRCRLLTSFLGLVFFLLSVMAVSLMLTRGRKMFGSMV